MHEPIPAYGSISALSAVLDELDEGLLVVGSDNRIACINKRLRHILGIDRDAAGGTDATRFVHQTLAPRIAEESCRRDLLEFFSGRQRSLDLSCTLLTSGGKSNRVCCSCKTVGSGLFQGMRVARFETVPREDSASPGWIGDLLRQDDDWYRFLVENLNEGIGLIDREGIVVFANKRLADIIGCPIAETVGAPASRFTDEEGARCMEDYLQNLDTFPHEIFEIDLIRRDGIRIHALMATTPVIDASGACRGFLAGVLDITPLKQMELQLEESKEKYRSLVELSAEAILIYQDGIVTYINPAGVKLLGAQDPGEVIGTNVADIIHPGSRETVRSFAARNLQRGETPLVELPVVRLDGTMVFVEGRGTRAFFAGRPAVQVVMRDITHRKQAEERLQALKKLGVGLVVDDFGTGYSSLESFAASAFDALKIDQVFIRDLESNHRHRAIVKTIIGFAKDLGLLLTAEGIETSGQRQLLLDMGCEIGQGYWYDKPLSAHDFEQRLYKMFGNKH